MRDDSKCRKAIFCDFVLTGDYPDATIEVCRQCGKKVIYRKVGGRIDNKKYLRDHVRSTLQPYGKTKKLFFQIYGSKIYTETMKELLKKKTKAETMKMWEDIRKDIAKPERNYI